MQSKKWIPFLIILLFSAGIIWITTRKPPPEIPRYPKVIGEVYGIDRVTLFVFLPFPDRQQAVLFADFQKEKHQKLKGGFDILFFNDLHNTPTTYPITQTQTKHLCARYTYNPKAGRDQFSWIIPPENSSSGH